MKNTPIERHLIDETINEFQIVDFSKATIREVKAIASKAEAASGVEFIKMEMGVPGLPPSAVGVKAEIEALQNGIASLYPDINGLPELKKRGVQLYQSIYQRGFKSGGMRTCHRLNARHIRFIPHLQPMRRKERYDFIHRSRISGTEAAVGSNGTKVRNV